MKTSSAAQGAAASTPDPDIIMGQKLYREIQHRHFPPEIKEYTVSKIGKKYFYLLENEDYSIDKTTLEYKDKIYSQNNFQLYRTRKEIEDINEMHSLRNKLRKHFDFFNNMNDDTLEQLREVVKILKL